MTLFLAADPPTTADWMTAWGTLLTALIAIGAIVTTVALAVLDRQRASRELTAAEGRYETERDAAATRFEEERGRYQADLKRAEERVAEEREQRANDAVLRTLESVAEQYARRVANAGQPAETEATGRLLVLLRMLPDGMGSYLKHMLSVSGGPLDQKEIKDLQEEKRTFNLAEVMEDGWIYGELAKNARQAAGLPPA